jgi:hypothetical protein
MPGLGPGQTSDPCLTGLAAQHPRRRPDRLRSRARGSRASRGTAESGWVPNGPARCVTWRSATPRRAPRPARPGPIPIKPENAGPSRPVPDGSAAARKWGVSRHQQAAGAAAAAAERSCPAPAATARRLPARGGGGSGGGLILGGRGWGWRRNGSAGFCGGTGAPSRGAACGGGQRQGYIHNFNYNIILNK